MKKIIALLLLFSALISCEKDDICTEDTLTTSRLSMAFYDNSNQDALKNVFKFRVQGDGNDTILDGFNIVTASSMLLPLKTTENETRFLLHKDYEIDNNGTPDDETDDIVLGNQDIITISYLPKEVYVSRSCGYKTTFTNITVVVENDSDNWIQRIESVNDNQIIENETAVHFKIFH